MPNDILKTVFVLEDQYSDAAKKATNATLGFSNALGNGSSSGLAGAASFALSELDSGTPILGEIVSILKSIAIVSIGAGVALVGMSAYAMKTAGDMESLRLGLKVYAGTAEETDRQLRRLREVARLPGLGFREAVEGSIRLQAVGANARLAERALMAFGNAVASSGGGKDELDGVMLALTQIVSKGVVSAEEINQIAERVPQIRKVLKDAFGTADTEALQKMGISAEDFVQRVIAAFEKLPKATTGAKNAFENIGDVVDRIVVQIGDALNKALVPALDKVSGFFDYLENIKVFDTIATGMLVATNNASAFGDAVKTGVQNLQTVAGLVSEVAAGPIGFLANSEDFGDALVRAAALVVSTLMQIPDIFTAVMTIIDENMQKIKGFINSVIELVNGIIATLKGGLNTDIKIAGIRVGSIETSTPGADALKKIDTTGDAGAAGMTPGQQALKDALDKASGYANALYEGNKHYKPSDDVANDKDPGGFVSQTASASLRTANATESIRDGINKLTEQLLGGSGLAHNAVRARNIGRATGQGAGHADLERGFDYMRRAFESANGSGFVANKRMQGAY